MSGGLQAQTFHDLLDIVNTVATIKVNGTKDCLYSSCHRNWRNEMTLRWICADVFLQSFHPTNPIQIDVRTNNRNNLIGAF